MSPADRVAIFVNEAAGSAGSPRVRETVELARHVLRADVHVTATRDHDVLRNWLDALIEPYGTAIIAGGDGSLGAALNVAAPRGIAVGYIPAGFGNATAYLLRLPRRPEALVNILAGGQWRETDLVRVDGHLALFAGAGWDAAVAGRYAAGGARRLRGWATAIVGSGGDLVHRHRARVEADGATVHHGPFELLVVSTTPFYGRGMVVNPGAESEAGRLMLRVYPGPAAKLALEAARWMLHRPPVAAGVAAERVVVEATDGRSIPLQADGDLLGERTRWEFEVVPAAVRLIASQP